jgi:hypothetical protein
MEIHEYEPHSPKSTFRKNTTQLFAPTIHIQYSKLQPSNGRLAIRRTEQRYANLFL